MRSHYVCWDRSDVFEVLNTEADKISPAVFLAVHTDRPMTRYERHLGRRDEAARSWPILAKDYLAEFLADGPNHIQSVILGGAGSGKSHFIKWLEFNIPAGGRFKVLSIPKMSVGLRDVIGMIIDVLPEDQRVDYREHLNRSGFEVASRDLQKHTLLAYIALAIRSLHPDTPQSEFLIRGLPLLFEDPDYKSSLIGRERSVLDDLVDHLVATPRYERRTDRRQFERRDLPLQGIDLLSLSEQTRTFMRQLMARDSLVEPALRIVNLGTDKAIGNLLEFPDDRLLGLMRDVRRHLGSRGEALVLLVEDFAVMQGVDYALLQALTERATGEEDGLCEIRWAMAMTDGYYEVLPDTFKDRMDLVVGMDLQTLGEAEPTPGEVGMTPDGIVEFAARYLRATRLSRRELEQWYRESRDEDAVPPTKCRTCPLSAECLPAFGESDDGTGLYPFSRNAIANILKRADPSAATRFNPRALIRDVLRPWLGDRVMDFDKGWFPSQSLLESLGGSTLGSADRTLHPDLTPRHLAVLEFWGTPGQLTVLSPTVYEAFGLTPPRLDDAIDIGSGAGSGSARYAHAGTGTSSARESGTSSRTSTSPSPQVNELDAEFRALEAWGRGDKIAPEVAQRVRDAVYDAVVAYIDWDALGIQQSFAAGTSAPTLFRPRSVTLRRQETGAIATPVRLQLPLVEGEQENRDTVLALQALIEFRRRGGIGLANAWLRTSKLRVAIQSWSDEIIRQIVALTSPAAVSLGDAALALLATQAAMSGAARNQKVGDDPTRLLLGVLPQSSSASSQSWRALYAALANKRPQLVEIVRAFMSGTKGGTAGRFVDADRISRVYYAQAKSWNLTAYSAANFSGSDAAELVAVLLRTTANSLQTAVAEELEATATWFDDIKPLGRTEVEAQAALDELGSLLQLARGVPIMVPTHLQDAFRDAAEAFVPSSFALAVQHARVALGGTVSLHRLVDEELLPTRRAALAFLKAASSVTSQLTPAVESRGEAMGHLQQRVKTDRGSIAAALVRLPELLVELQDRSNA
jgi:hypothetical protein